MEYITPTQMIEQLQIKPITLRRWCVTYGSHLSPGATPDPGVNRRFTGRDLEVLRHVRSLRDQGVGAAQINEQLASLTFPEIEHSDPEDDQEDDPEANVTAVTASMSLPADLNALYALDHRIARLERRRFDSITLIGLGFGLGLLFMVAMLLLASIYGQ